MAAQSVQFIAHGGLRSDGYMYMLQVTATVTVTKIAAATRARAPCATTRTPPCQALPWDGMFGYGSDRASNGYGYRRSDTNVDARDGTHTKSKIDSER